MSEAESLRAEMMKRLECAVCFQTMNSTDRLPRLLTCFHTYCAACLEAIKVESGCILCPQCRRPTSIDSGVSSLPVNFLVRDLIEVLALEAKSELAGPKLCELCDDPATHRCNTCIHFLCDGHGTLHRKEKGKASHEVVTVQEFVKSGASRGAPLTIPRCSVHEGQALEFYCVTCNVPTCVKCSLVAHRLHSQDELKDVWSRDKQTMQTLMSHARVRAEQIAIAMQGVSAMKQSVEDRKSAASADLSAAFQSLRQALDARERALHQNLEAVASAKTQALSAQLETLTAAHKSVVNACQETERMLGHENDVRVLALRAQIVRNFEQLRSTPLEFQPQVTADFSFQMDANLLAQCSATGFIEDNAAVPWQCTVSSPQAVQGVAAFGYAFGPQAGSPPPSDKQVNLINDGEAIAAPGGPSANASVSAGAYSPSPVLGPHAMHSPSLGSPQQSLQHQHQQQSSQSSQQHGPPHNQQQNQPLLIRTTRKAEVTLVITARDARGLQRNTGGDPFQVDLYPCSEGQFQSASPVIHAAEGLPVPSIEEKRGMLAVEGQNSGVASLPASPGLLQRERTVEGRDFKSVAPLSASNAAPVREGRADVKLIDHRDGTYTASFLLNSLGDYRADITLRGAPICGSPVLVQVVSDGAEGKFVMRIGQGKGSDRGFFHSPTSVAISSVDGMVFVADQYNSRIQAFRSDGSFSHRWGQQGSGDGCFSSPFSVACDKQGRVYVCDRDNYRIQVFTPAGAFVTKWGSRGTAAGSFDRPWALAIGTVSIPASGAGQQPQQQEFVFVADDCNNRIQVFTTSGVFVRKFGDKDSRSGSGAPCPVVLNPSGLAVDDQGVLYVPDWKKACVHLFRAADGTFLGEWTSAAVGFRYPFGIGVSPSTIANNAAGPSVGSPQQQQALSHSGGLIYVADRRTQCVTVMRRDGSVVRRFGHPQSQNPAAGAGGNNSNAGSNGSQQQSGGNSNNSAAAAVSPASVKSDGTFAEPYGIAVAPNGLVYVTDGENHTVQVFS